MEFSFHTAALTALPSGALWWRAQRLLCVSDLHLGKSERMARRAGALLPPYEVAETLSKLEADISTHTPAMVVCLGDSFDDLAASAGLSEAARMRLTVLQAGRQWVWIEGNHDTGPLDLGGVYLGQFKLDGLVFRHIAAGPRHDFVGEISGHYHPKVRLAGQNLPAFLLGQNRLILPAYGHYTGGMMAAQEPLAQIISAPARAFVLQGGRVLQVPISPPNRARG